MRAGRGPCYLSGMKTTLWAFALGGISIMLGACSSVTSSEPVGSTVPDLTDSKFSGKWRMVDGDEFEISVVSAPEGILRITGEEKDEEGNIKKSSIKGYVRGDEDWMFLSLTEKADGEKKDDHKYLWGRLSGDEDTLLFWLPDVEKFENLVKSETFPGKIVKKKPAKEDTIQISSTDVQLGKLTAAHLKAIKDETHGVLFEWDSPVIAIRVKEKAK